MHFFPTFLLSIYLFHFIFGWRVVSAALPMGLDHHQGHHHQQQQAGGGLQLGLRDTTSLHLHQQQQQQQGRQDMTGGTRRPENQGTKNLRTKQTKGPKAPEHRRTRIYFLQNEAYYIRAYHLNNKSFFTSHVEKGR